MKHGLTTGTWQDDTGCPISIILVSTSDDRQYQALERTLGWMLEESTHWTNELRDVRNLNSSLSN